MKKKKINFKRVRALFIISHFCFVAGSAFNMTALENNQGMMPVLNSSANVYFLTDIFPTIITDYYFSVGDVFILLASILFYIAIFKSIGVKK